MSGSLLGLVDPTPVERPCPYCDTVVEAVWIAYYERGRKGLREYGSMWKEAEHPCPLAEAVRTAQGVAR